MSEPKVKNLERKLKQSEVDFMKLIEEQNLNRVKKLQKTRRSNIITGKLSQISYFIITFYNCSFYFC